ncbi:HTH-type transcriptional activator Btr [compost metagenome]
MEKLLRVKVTEAGTSPGGVINRYAAAELLLGTALKMHEISGQLGFSDQHYFFRFFKKTVGCTPQEYREHRKVQA